MGNTFPTIIPHLLSSGLSATAKSEGKDYDVFIGGVPFLVKATEKNPYIRETAPVRKDQLSTSGPGEESLSGSWLRSQASWHGGAGLKYLDSDEDAAPITRHRYEWSRGVDPFTPGELTPLPGMSMIGGTSAVTGVIQFGAGVAVSRGESVDVVEAGVVTATLTFDTAVVSMTTDGVNVIVATDSGIYTAAVTAPTPVKLYDLTSGSNVVLGWVKARLIAGIGNALHELAAAGPALPTATYTHPVAAWRWTFIHEAPQDILIGGYAGSVSNIMALRVSTTGETPVLGGGPVVATMPAGETALCMASISGSVLAIGTARGVRVGGWDLFYASLTFGPLTVESATPVRSISGWDRFFYAAVTNLKDVPAGVAVIDPGTVTDKREMPGYAWAPGLEAPAVAGTTWCAAASDGVCIAVSGAGAYWPDPAVAPVACYIQHSRVRYGTLEPKLFQLLAVTGSLPGSTLSVQASSSTGEEPSAVTLTGAEEYQAKFKLLLDKAEWAAVKWTFTAASGAQDFLMRSWQMFSQPAPIAQKLIQLPLLCADFELDARGNRMGYEGYGAERLAALELGERGGGIYTIEYRNLGPVANELVTLEKVSYQRINSVPRSGGGDRDEGGIILLQARTVR